jgi:hypothetical protein
MDGLPNNLTAQGLLLLEGLTNQKLPPAALNFYIAAVYNSEVAIEFMEEAGSGTAFGVRLPHNGATFEIAANLARSGRIMRDLLWLLNITEEETELEASFLEERFSQQFLGSVRVKPMQAHSRRFKARAMYHIPETLKADIEEATSSVQAGIDKLAADLYS